MLTISAHCYFVSLRYFKSVKCYIYYSIFSLCLAFTGASHIITPYNKFFHISLVLVHWLALQKGWSEHTIQIIMRTNINFLWVVLCKFVIIILYRVQKLSLLEELPNILKNQSLLHFLLKKIRNVL